MRATNHTMKTQHITLNLHEESYNSQQQQSFSQRKRLKRAWNGLSRFQKNLVFAVLVTIGFIVVVVQTSFVRRPPPSSKLESQKIFKVEVQPDVVVVPPVVVIPDLPPKSSTQSAAAALDDNSVNDIEKSSLRRQPAIKEFKFKVSKGL